MNSQASDPRSKLRQFSEDCCQRAADAKHSDAMWLFSKAAQVARQSAGNHHLPPEALGEALQALQQLRNVAAWCNGEAVDDIFRNDNSVTQTYAANAKPLKFKALDPIDPLNARQLAGLYGMSENGARKVIQRGFGRGLRGFGKDGALWLADADAFTRLQRKCGIGVGGG